MFSVYTLMCKGNKTRHNQQLYDKAHDKQTKQFYIDVKYRK